MVVVSVEGCRKKALEKLFSARHAVVTAW